MPEKKKATAKKKTTAARKTTTRKTAAKKTGKRKTGARKPRTRQAPQVAVEIAEATESGPVRLRITQTRSPIGRPRNQKLTLQALGLRRIGHTVEHEGTPSIRGMVNTVVHLVRVEQIR
jgi:large subunit ribosomal protein L30